MRVVVAVLPWLIIVLVFIAAMRYSSAIQADYRLAPRWSLWYRVNDLERRVEALEAGHE